MKKAERYFIRFILWRQNNISNNSFRMILAVVIGALVSFAAIALKTMISYIERDVVSIFPTLLLFMIPATGIFLTVFLKNRVFKEQDQFSGIAHILHSIARKSGVIKRIKTYSQLILSAITVAFGGSVGLEAPIAVTGAAIGSNMAGFFRLDYSKKTLFIGCGVAAATAAIFNSPIAGVIFAIEVILPQISTVYFIPILLSSATGNLLSNLLLPNSAMLRVPEMVQFHNRELPVYIFIAVIGGLYALYFTKTQGWVHKKLKRIKSIYAKALFAGVLLGGVILLLPPLYGEGYLGLRSLLNNSSSELFSNVRYLDFGVNPIMSLGFFLLLLLFKPLLTALTIEAGGVGGAFAPSLFTGGLLGFVVSSLYVFIFPESTFPIVNGVLLGMAAVLSGVMHAPLTSIFLIAEITNSYTLIVPLMIAAAISFFAKTYFDPVAIYAKTLKKVGTTGQSNQDLMILNELDLVKLIEKDIVPIRYEGKLKDLLEVVAISRRNIFPVVNNEQILLGIILLDDIREFMFDRSQYEVVKIVDLMHVPPAYIHVGDSMIKVMEHFDKSGAWNLPVIKEGKYMGFISKSSVLSNYRERLNLQNEISTLMD